MKKSLANLGFYLDLKVGIPVQRAVELAIQEPLNAIKRALSDRCRVCNNFGIEGLKPDSEYKYMFTLDAVKVAKARDKGCVLCSLVYDIATHFGLWLERKSCQFMYWPRNGIFLFDDTSILDATVMSNVKVGKYIRIRAPKGMI